MSIKESLVELENLEQEIKRHRSIIKEMTTRKKDIENEIQEYLVSKDQEGMKYNGKAILLEHGEKRPTKTPKDKKQSVIKLLEGLGVYNPEEMYSQITDVTKGSPRQTRKVVIKQIKK